MTSIKPWVKRIALVVLIPLIAIISWMGFEVSQSCRAHHIFISRTHTDDKAVTVIRDDKNIIWEGVPSFMYSKIIVDKPFEGGFDFTTKFSDGTERVSQGGYVTVADSYHHYMNIGKAEDAYVDKKISFFAVIRDVLSCAALR